MEKLAEQEKNAGSGEIIPNYSDMADLAGIDRREDKGNTAYQSLSRGEIPSMHIKTPVHYLILQGKYIHKENGVETSEYSKMYNKERSKFFLDAPFEISLLLYHEKSAHAQLRKENRESANDSADGE